MGRLYNRMKWSVLLLIISLVAGCASFGDKGARVKQELAQMEKLSGLLEVGEKLYKNGQLTMAAEHFDDVLLIESDNLAALYRLGNISFRHQELDRAANYFGAVIELNPRHARAHYNVAVIDLMKAQRHLQLYVATADPSADLQKVRKILAEINTFAMNDADSKKRRLDKLWRELESK